MSTAFSKRSNFPECPGWDGQLQSPRAPSRASAFDCFQASVRSASNRALSSASATPPEPAGEHRSFPSAYRLIDQVLSEDGAQQIRHRELDLVDMPLGRGITGDAVIRP